MPLMFIGKYTDTSTLANRFQFLDDNISSCFHGPYDVLLYSGSGKTFTMKPLPIRAVEDLMRLLRQPVYSNQKFKLWLSYFEIYGGKLFDLLSERK